MDKSQKLLSSGEDLQRVGKWCDTVASGESITLDDLRSGAQDTLPMMIDGHPSRWDASTLNRPESTYKKPESSIGTETYQYDKGSVFTADGTTLCPPRGTVHHHHHHHHHHHYHYGSQEGYLSPAPIKYQSSATQTSTTPDPEQGERSKKEKKYKEDNKVFGFHPCVFVGLMCVGSCLSGVKTVATAICENPCLPCCMVCGAIGWACGCLDCHDIL